MWTHGRFWLLAQSFCCWFSSLFPKLFVLSLMTWSLYAYFVLVESGFQVHGTKVALEAAIVVLYVLSIYTYFKVIAVGPGSPLDFPELKISLENSANPYGGQDSSNHDASTFVGSPATSQTDYRVSIDSLDADDSAHLLGGSAHSGSPTQHRSPPIEIFTSHTFKNSAPAYRWCSTCSVWKPDRCHHCSTCNQCYLRMDHHCPWFACCIGFYNQKFFIQVLIYMQMFCGLALAVSFSLLYQFFLDEEWENDHYLSLNLVFLFVLSLAFFVAMTLFTVFSIYMVLKNTTTIEFQDNRWNYLENSGGQYKFDANGKKEKLGHIYDLGWKKNWTSIFGSSWVGWILPTTVTRKALSAEYANGVNFEVNQELFDTYCHNAQLQDQLNQQLSEYRERLRGNT